MTREEDVAAAVESGADALGFVLWPGSPRHVDVDRAAALIGVLPRDVTPVGVFVQPSRDDITRAVERAGIRVAQVHGTADVALSGVSCDVWVAASIQGDDITPPVRAEYTVLLDTHDPQRHGGTGRTIDWSRAARVAARRPVMLAGGLTPDNVAEAIREVRPYGVDVASGIEHRPGVKDAHGMRAFVAAVREADQ
ncbi:MAG: phosphoribosylanthranilate isomerase [Vicinamibacterales bacterium]